jgi:hypothetical protein
LHAAYDSRELTEPARKAFLQQFEDQVDPDNVLPEGERKRRAQHARQAHFTRLALLSAKARREKVGNRRQAGVPPQDTHITEEPPLQEAAEGEV